MVSLKEIADALLENDYFYILTHRYPDGDTLGSAAALLRALNKMGKHAKVLCNDEIAEKFEYLFDCVKDEDFSPKFIISVDVADLDLLGEKLSVYKDRIDICIDHHESNSILAKQCYVDPKAAATAEIIYDLIELLNVDIDIPTASCIYTGISTDTGCFKYSNTTSKTHKIAARLLDIGVDAYKINKVMFDTKSKARIELEKLVMDTLEFAFDDRCALICITSDMIEKSKVDDSEVEGFASIPICIDGVLVGITVREKENGLYKVSVRTGKEIQANLICEHFGGGGHKAAAGCSIKGQLDEVKKKILSVCIDRIKESV